MNTRTVWGPKKRVNHATASMSVLFSSFPWPPHKKGLNLVFENSEFWNYTMVLLSSCLLFILLFASPLLPNINIQYENNLEIVTFLFLKIYLSIYLRNSECEREHEWWEGRRRGRSRPPAPACLSREPDARTPAP